MSIISIPSIRASKLDMRLERSDIPIELMDGSEVIAVQQKAIWKLSYPLVVLSEADSREWFGALVQLAKLENQLQLTPVDYDGPATGYSGSNPVVNGADQTGTSLICDGVTISTDIVKAGDVGTVNGEFKMFTADASSDGSGNVTLSFEPQLRSAPSDGATFEIQTPLITMRWNNPEIMWSAVPPKLYSIVLELRESF